MSSSNHREWYKIRDFFLGRNFVAHDFSRALLLASQHCNDHEDAAWLCRVFAEGVPKSREEVLKVLQKHLDDFRGRTFYALLSEFPRLQLIEECKKVSKEGMKN